MKIMKVSNGLYRHYKGHIYMVDGVAKHTETLEDLVEYHAMYVDPEFGPYAHWVRPIGMFLENVEVNGQRVPRFEKLSDQESLAFLQGMLLKIAEENPEILEKND